MITAPVSVAISITFFAPRRQAYHTPSASTMRPSASVETTSIVLPLAARTISPGRCALPSGIFSAQASTPITLQGSPRRAIARIAPSTSAAPVISSFISPMLSSGLMEMPPLSKVTPLPTKAVYGASPAPLYCSAIMRGGFSLPRPTASIASMPLSFKSTSSSTVTSSGSSLPIASAASTITWGVTTLPGLFTRSRVKQTASASISATSTSLALSSALLKSFTAHSGASFASLLKLLKV